MGRFMQPVLLLPSGRGQSCRHSPIEGLLAGILGGLSSNGLHENQCRRGWPMLQPCVRYSALKQLWIHVVDMAGFRPEEIDIKVKDNLISVQAKHEEVDGEDSDVVERKRSVKVPEGVNLKKLACFVHREGKLVIQAPFSTKRQCDGTKNCGLQTESEESNPKQSHNKLQHEENCQSETLSEKSQNKEHCDSTEVSEQSSTETSHEELHLEKNHAEIQQLSADCPDSKEPNDEDIEDGKQINVAVDLLPSNTDDNLISDDDRCDSPVQRVEKIESVIHNGEHDTGNDTSLYEDETLELLMDKTDIVEKDAQKYFCARMNLENFPTDDIRVLCQDNTLYVDAKREWDDSGVKGYQEFHRQFQLPNNASEAEARAFVSDSGYFTIKVPIKEEVSVEKPAEQN